MKTRLLFSAMRLHMVLLIVMGIVLFGASAHAITLLTAELTNAQEVPPAIPTTTTTGASRPASFGTASLVLNDAQTSMTLISTIFNIDFTGTQTVDVNDNLTAAHIHASPDVTPATTAPVVWGFFGQPFNDNNPVDLVVNPFLTGVGGVINSKWDAPEGNNTTLAEQLPNILSGRSYLNFHTVQFPGGEARGAINVATNVVPEPSTVAQLIITFVSLFGIGLLRSRGLLR